VANPVTYFEIIGKDAKKLYSFYGDLFGWEFPASEGPVEYRHVQGARLEGGVGEEPDGSGHVTVYVAVPDLQAALDKAESLGGKTVLPPSNVGVKIAQFTDPQGNLIGLVEAPSAS
jgi:predicted enzyme related to lactoylglutathione lyase